MMVHESKIGFRIAVHKLHLSIMRIMDQAECCGWNNDFTQAQNKSAGLIPEPHQTLISSVL